MAEFCQIFYMTFDIFFQQTYLTDSAFGLRFFDWFLTYFLIRLLDWFFELFIMDWFVLNDLLDWFFDCFLPNFSTNLFDWYVQLFFDFLTCLSFIYYLFGNNPLHFHDLCPRTWSATRQLWRSKSVLLS